MNHKVYILLTPTVTYSCAGLNPGTKWKIRKGFCAESKQEGESIRRKK